MFSETFKSAWSNVEKALGNASFSQYCQQHKTPQELRSRSNTVAPFRHILRLPQRLNSGFIEDLLKARCKDNGHDSIIASEKFKKFLEKLTRNKQLNLANMNLRKHSAKVIAHFLERDEHYLKVNLSNNPLQDQGIIDLCEPLSRNRNIIHLDISKSSITSKGFREIFPLLKNMYTLISLNLSQNHISGKGSRSLQQLVNDHGNIQFLNISSTFCNVIQGHFTYLNMSFNNIVSTTDISCVIDLDLSDNPLITIAPLSKRIMHWQIVKLNLSNTKLNLQGLQILVEGIVSQIHLQYLDISRNNFQGQLIYLSKLLIQNKTIKILKLSECNINEFAKLSEGLKENKTLEYLDLSINSIDIFGCQVLGQNLNRIKSLILNRCRLQQGVNHIFMKLQLCCKLEIRDNSISDLSGLIDLLKRNHNLVKVDLSLNHIHFKQQMDIEELLCKNNEIQKKSVIPQALLKVEELSDYKYKQQQVRDSQISINIQHNNRRQQLEELQLQLISVKIDELDKTEQRRKQLEQLTNQRVEIVRAEDKITKEKELFHYTYLNTCEQLRKDIQQEQQIYDKTTQLINKKAVQKQLLNTVMPQQIMRLKQQLLEQTMILESAQRQFELL